jgi:hypothetical protein
MFGELMKMSGDIAVLKTDAKRFRRDYDKAMPKILSRLNDLESAVIEFSTSIGKIDVEIDRMQRWLSTLPYEYHSSQCSPRSQPSPQRRSSPQPSAHPSDQLKPSHDESAPPADSKSRRERDLGRVTTSELQTADEIIDETIKWLKANS